MGEYDEEGEYIYAPGEYNRLSKIANEKYRIAQKNQKRKDFWGGLLGAGIVIISIPLGIADVVAPLMIIAFVLYMIFHG